MKFKFVLWGNSELLHVICIWYLLGRVETIHFKFENASGLLEFVHLRVPKRKDISFHTHIAADARVSFGSKRKLKVSHLIFGKFIFSISLYISLRPVHVYVL